MASARVGVISFLIQAESVREEIENNFFRSHQILEVKESDLLSELDQLVASYKGVEVNEQIQELNRMKASLESNVEHNENQETVVKSVAVMDSRISELKTSLETTVARMRSVELRWNGELEKKLNQIGWIWVDYEEDRKHLRSGLEEMSNEFGQDDAHTKKLLCRIKQIEEGLKEFDRTLRPLLFSGQIKPDDKNLPAPDPKTVKNFPKSVNIPIDIKDSLKLYNLKHKLKQRKNVSSIIFYNMIPFKTMALSSLKNPDSHKDNQVLVKVEEIHRLGYLKVITSKINDKTEMIAGIKLQEPYGNSNGAHESVKHFDCPPNYAVFVPINEVFVPAI